MTASSACRSCRRPLLWLRTGGGKHMPVDPDPVLGGNLLADTRRGTVEVVHEQARIDAEERGEPLYVSHFVTCPNADEHRQRRGGSA